MAQNKRVCRRDAAYCLQKLSVDVMLHMLDFVCYVDAKALIFANPKCHNTAVAMFMRHKIDDTVQKYLQRLVPSVVHTLRPSDFLRVLENSHSVITGSFLLCCMYDEIERWVPNNIDIVSFAYKEDCNEHGQDAEKDINCDICKYGFFDDAFLQQWSMSIDSKSHLGLRNIVERKIFDAAQTYHRSTLVPPCVRAPTHKFYEGDTQYPFLFCEIALPTPNLINVQRYGCFVKPAEFITKFFDMDVCKIAYDGNHRLQVFSWEHLFSRSSNLDFDAHFYAHHRQDLLQHEEKYPDIDVQPTCTFVKALKEANCERLLFRQAEYTARGFCITFGSPQNDDCDLLDLHRRLDDLFADEMKFLDLLREYQQTGIKPDGLFEAHTKIDMRVAARFAKFIGILNFPANCRFYIT